MANQGLFFDLGQQSMLKIIRSARSQFRREQSVDEAQSRSSMGQAVGSQLSGDRYSKRSSASRSAFGGVSRHRLSRSRSSLETTASENAAPEKPQQAPILGGPVLGDVTNVTNTSGAAEVEKCPKPSSVDAPIYEPGPAVVATKSAKSATVTNSPDQLETDARHADDPQYVMEYMSDIFRAMQRIEGLHEAKPGYMESQVHVNAKMRGILVDWLVSVQQKYKLKAETLFLAVSVLDRYLEQKATARRHLQLAGVTSLLIAAKFEEMYPPQIADLVHVTDKAYTRDDILKMEVSILTALDFKICSPTSMLFLERYQSVNGCNEAHKFLAQYLVELALPDYNMLKYGASCRAASAVFLSNKLLRHQPAWKAAAVKVSHFNEAMLKDCAKEMCALLEYAETNPLQAIRKKFSQLKYQKVAQLNFTGNSPASQNAEEPRSNPPVERRRSVVGAERERRRTVVGTDPSLGPRLPLCSPGAPTDM